MRILCKIILCKIFGHPDRPHFHKKEDFVACRGGCEKYEKVYEILPCPRCGYKIK